MSEERLREYIENDRAYQDYKMKKPVSDYKRLHIALCEDIENVLNELEQLQTNWKELKKYLTKEQARIVIDNTDEDEFVYTDILIKMQEIESGKNE